MYNKYISIFVYIYLLLIHTTLGLEHVFEGDPDSPLWLFRETAQRPWPAPRVFKGAQSHCLTHQGGSRFFQKMHQESPRRLHDAFTRPQNCTRSLQDMTLISRFLGKEVGFQTDQKRSLGLKSQKAFCTKVFILNKILIPTKKE